MLKKCIYMILIIFILISCSKKNEVENKENLINEQVYSEENNKERIEESSKLDMMSFDWYTGLWISNSIDDGNLTITKDGEKYVVELNTGNELFIGSLDTMKYFLPNDVSEEEIMDYDTSDYVIIKFENELYWVSIIEDNDTDKISLNIGDIDVFRFQRNNH